MGIFELRLRTEHELEFTLALHDAKSSRCAPSVGHPLDECARTSMTYLFVRLFGRPLNLATNLACGTEVTPLL